MTHGFGRFACGGTHIGAMIVWVTVCAVAAHAAEYDAMPRLDTASNKYIASHGATAKKDAVQKVSILQRDGFDCTKTVDAGVRTKMLKMEQGAAMADKDYDAFNDLQVELNIIREIAKDCNDNNLAAAATADSAAGDRGIPPLSNDTHILGATGDSVIDNMSSDSDGNHSESGNSRSLSDSSGSAGSSSSDGLNKDNGDDRRFWFGSSGEGGGSSGGGGGGSSSGSRFSSVCSCSLSQCSFVFVSS